MLRLNRNKKRKGAALVEYGLLIAGVALMAAAAVSTFGHKTSDLIAAVAAVLPGAHADDNGPILSGRIIETTAATDATTPIQLDIPTIVGNTNTSRLGNSTNLAIDTLVLEP